MGYSNDGFRVVVGYNHPMVLMYSDRGDFEKQNPSWRSMLDMRYQCFPYILLGSICLKDRPQGGYDVTNE